MAYASSTAVEPIAVLSDRLRLLLRSADSPSRMTAMVVEVPPGGGVPLHSHDREEEGYFVLEGSLALSIGDQTRLLAPGDFGHVPPQTPHGYANNGAGLVRFLAWTVGGPLDEFFLAMAHDVREMPRDAPAMAAIAARYGVRMMGAAG